ncbi:MULTISPECIES: protein YgfX [unclassified Neisseria]|uniref:protein YgfX n=1 Tax=unclassified Neisseria TaxID=2623750 RepID=UPI002666D69D|nr:MULTISPECIES: protein YgfX [unclassified Neisseria]MDO1510893.1 hypothetical protein [Neisseria sp. MVDL19-042950]MDO1517183.1 hypothetical protein [Neisseria sp. MVDL18-041461]MDO1564548.1 hypothetical protein [Neisseria sp. MVDL20-010259]
MQAFQTALKHSKTGLVLTVLLHIWAAATCLFSFYGTFRIIGLLLLSAAFAWAWQTQKLRRHDAIHKIAVSRQGNAAVFVGSEQTAFTASLCAGSLISRYALFLKWDLGDRQIRQFILPDMTDRESYRRLLVWARWGQPKP